MRLSDSYTKEDILRFLGLANRASKVVSGNDQIIDEARKGRIKLLIVARDISQNTFDKFLSVLATLESEIPSAYRFADKRSLGNAIGRPDRALVGITDEGFAGKLEIMLDRFEYKEEQN
ncbi:MAG: ribosomal L7Ae/L30e/S12e/Gadd45 family protein [Clostridiales bacterium]|nr:ribosomal L7Ae/L30e/S12e/Gadd45 family protein [Clostridiales bacterium]